MERVKYCKRGHERTPENTAPDGRCVECRKAARLLLARSRGIKPKNYDFCKNGHPRTPESIYPKNGMCLLCQKEYQKSSSYTDYTERYSKSDAAKESRKRYMGSPKGRQSLKKHNAKKISELSSPYLINLLGIATSKASDDLIELKRQQLKLTRFVRKAKQAKEKENGNIPCNA